MVKIFSIALKWFDTSQTIETRSILRILLCKHRQVRNMQRKAHKYDSNAHRQRHSTHHGSSSSLLQANHNEEAKEREQNKRSYDTVLRNSSFSLSASCMVIHCSSAKESQNTAIHLIYCLIPNWDQLHNFSYIFLLMIFRNTSEILR